jgi:hypothetical protein
MKINKGLIGFISCIAVSAFAIVAGVIAMIIQSDNPIGLGLLSLVFGIMILFATIGFQTTSDYFNIKNKE